MWLPSSNTNFFWININSAYLLIVQYLLLLLVLFLLSSLLLYISFSFTNYSYMTFGNISTLPFNTCDARELKCINANDRYFSNENKEHNENITENNKSIDIDIEDQELNFSTVSNCKYFTCESFQYLDLRKKLRSFIAIIMELNLNLNYNIHLFPTLFLA